MTNPFDPTDLPSDPADEVASAYLDGAATPAEIERVESDGALADRVGDLSAVSGRVGDVSPAPAGVVDAAISAALSEYDRIGDDRSDDDATDGGTGATDGGTGSAPTAAPVIALASRRPSWSRLPLGAVAAVVVLVALVGVVGLASRGGDGTDTATSAMEDSADEGGDAGATAQSEAADDGADEMSDAVAADSPEAALDQTEDAGARVERLRFSSPDTLADYLRAQLRPASTSTGADDDGVGSDGSDEAEAPPTVDDPDPCDAVQVIGLDPSTVRTVVPVLLDQQPATAVVHGDEGDERLVVVDDSSCQVVVDREL